MSSSCPKQVRHGRVWGSGSKDNDILVLSSGLKNSFNEIHKLPLSLTSLEANVYLRPAFHLFRTGNWPVDFQTYINLSTSSHHETVWDNNN